MAIDATLWMPTGMDDGEKAEHDENHPGDPHGAAADAWESWAAQLTAAEATGVAEDVTQTVSSVSTGAQSVTYSSGQSVTPSSQARVQAAWHRARSKAESVPVGPQHYAVAEGTYLNDIGSLPGATTGGNDESNDALWNLGAP